MPSFVSSMASGGRLRFSLFGVAVVSLLALGVHGDVADTSRARGDGGVVDGGRRAEGFLYGEWLRDRRVYRFAGGGDLAVGQPGSFWADVAGEVRDSHWRRLRDVVVGALPRGGEVRDVFLRFGNGEEFDMREWREIRRRRIAGAFRDAPFAVVADVEAALSGALSGALVERLAFVRRARIDFRTGLGNRIASGGVEALGALRESDDDAVGWQMRGYVGDGVDSGLNAGVFYRRVVSEFGEELLGGVNTFLDYEKNADAGGFWRWSVGGKVKSRLGEISANRYLALTDAKRLSSGTYYSRDGFDSEVFMNVPEVEWMRVSFGYYNWRGEFGDADDAGLRLGAQFNPGGGVRLGLEFDGGEGDLGGNISYAHTFGEPAPSRGAAARGFDPRAHFFDAVRREYSQRISRAGGAGDGANFAVIVGTGLDITIRGELPGTSTATVSTLNIAAGGLTTGVNDEFAITGSVVVETGVGAGAATIRQKGGDWNVMMSANTEIAFVSMAATLRIDKGMGEFERVNPPHPSVIVFNGATMFPIGTRFRFGVPPVVNAQNKISVDLLEGGMSIAAAAMNSVTIRVGERASAVVAGADGSVTVVGCDTNASQSVNAGGAGARCSSGGNVDLTSAADAANVSVEGGRVLVPFGARATVGRFAVSMLAAETTLMASVETAGFALVTMTAAGSVGFELVIAAAANVAGAKNPRVSVWDAAGFFSPTVVQFAVRVARKLRVNVNPSQVGVTQNITAANIAVVNASEGTRDYLYSVITHDTLFNLDGNTVNNNAQITGTGALTVSLEATDALGDKATVDLTVNVAPTPALALTPLGLLVVGTSDIAVAAGGIIAAGGATPLTYNIAIGDNNFAATANLPSNAGAATVNVTTGAIQIRGSNVSQTFDLYYQVQDSAPGAQQQTTLGTVLVSVSEGVALSGPILNATVTATTNGGANTAITLGTVMAQLRAGLRVRSFNIAGGHAVLRPADDAARREVYYSGNTQTPDTVQLTIMVTDTSAGGAGDPPNSTEAVFYLAIVDPAPVAAGLSGAINLRYFVNEEAPVLTATASGGAGGNVFRISVGGGARIGNDGVLLYRGANTNPFTVTVFADDNHRNTHAAAAVTATLSAIARLRAANIPRPQITTGATVAAPYSRAVTLSAVGGAQPHNIAKIPEGTQFSNNINIGGETSVIFVPENTPFVALEINGGKAGLRNVVYRVIDAAIPARRQTLTATLAINSIVPRDVQAQKTDIGNVAITVGEAAAVRMNIDPRDGHTVTNYSFAQTDAGDIVMDSFARVNGSDNVRVLFAANAAGTVTVSVEVSDQHEDTAAATVTRRLIAIHSITLGYAPGADFTPQTMAAAITFASVTIGGGLNARGLRLAGQSGANSGDLYMNNNGALIVRNNNNRNESERAEAIVFTVVAVADFGAAATIAGSVEVVAALRLNGGGEYIVTVGSRGITVATIRAVGGERGDGYQFTDPSIAAPFAALEIDNAADLRVVKLNNTAIPASRNGQTDSLVFSVTDDATPQARYETTLTTRYVNPINAAHTYKAGGGAITTASGSQIIGTIAGSGGLGSFVYTEINNSPLNVNSDGEIAGTFTQPTTAVISVRVDDRRSGAQVAATHPVTVEVAVTALRPLAMPHTVFRITTNTHGARNDPTDWSLPLAQASGGQPPYFAVRPGCCNNYTRAGGYINPSRVLFLHTQGTFVWSGDATPTTEGEVVQDMIGFEDSSTPPRLYLFPLTMDFVFPPQVRANIQLRTRAAETGTSVTVAALTYSGGASGGNLTASVEVSNGAAEIDNNNVVWAGAAGGDATVFVHAYQSDNDTAPQSTATVVVNFVAPLTLVFGGGYESAPLTSAAAITVGTLQISGGNGNYGNPSFVSNQRDFAFVEGTIVVLNNNSQRNQSERTVTAVIRADDTGANGNISAPATISLTVEVVDRVKLRGGGRITVFAAADAGEVVAEFKPAGGIPPYTNLNKLLPATFPSGLQPSAAAKSVTITRTNTALTAGDEHIIAYEVTDDNGNGLSATATATITVINPISAAIDFAGGALTTGSAATVATISASGGVGDYTFTEDNANVNVVDGTVYVANFANAGTIDVNLIADDDNAAITEPATIGITLTALAPLVITPLEVMLTTGETTPADGTDAGIDIVASGGDGAYTYSYTGGGGNSPLRLGGGNNLVWTGNQLQSAPGTVVAEMMGVSDSSTPNRATARAISLIYVLPPSVMIDNTNQTVSRYKNEVSAAVASLSFSGGSGAAGLTATVAGFETGVTAAAANNNIIVSANAGVTGDKQITIVGFDSANDTAPAATATLTVHFVNPLSFANLPGAPLLVTTQDRQPSAVEAGVALPVSVPASGGNGTYNYTRSAIGFPAPGGQFSGGFVYENGVLRFNPNSGNEFHQAPVTVEAQIIASDAARDGYSQTATTRITIHFVDPRQDVTIGFESGADFTPLTSNANITVGTLVVGGGLNARDASIVGGDGFLIDNFDNEDTGTIALILGGNNDGERVAGVTLRGEDNHTNTGDALITVMVTVINRIKLNGGGRVTLFAGGAGAGAIATLAAVGGRGARTYGLATSPLPGYVSSAGGGAEALTLSYTAHADATVGAAAFITATVADDDNTATATVEVTIIAPVAAGVDFAGGALTTGSAATVATISASGGVGEYTFTGDNANVNVVDGSIYVANFANAGTIDINLIANDDNAPITEPVTIGITLTALAPISAPVLELTVTTATNPGAGGGVAAFTIQAAGGHAPYSYRLRSGGSDGNTAKQIAPGVLYYAGDSTSVVQYHTSAARNTPGAEAQTDLFVVYDSSTPPRRFTMLAATLHYVLPPDVAFGNINQSVARHRNGVSVTVATLAYSGGGGAAGLTATILGVESGVSAQVSDNEIVVSANAGETGDKEITIAAYDSANGTAPSAMTVVTVHFVAPLGFDNLPSAPLTVTTQDSQGSAVEAGKALPIQIDGSGGNTGNRVYTPPANYTYTGGLLRYDGNTFPASPSTADVEIIVADTPAVDGYAQTATATVTVAFVDPPPLTIGFDGAFNNTPLTQAAGAAIIVGTVVLGAGLNPNDPAILNDDGDFALGNPAGLGDGTVQLRLEGDNTIERQATVTLTGNDAHGNTPAVMMTVAVTVVNRIKLNGGGRVTLFAGGATGAIATLAAVGGRGARTYGLATSQTSPLPNYVQSAGGGAEALTLTYITHSDAVAGAAAFITATVADDDNTATATVEVTIIAPVSAGVDFAGGALTTGSAATVATLSASGGVGEHTFSANNAALSFVESTIAVANFASAATVNIDLIADDDNAPITEPATVGITVTALAPLVITPLAITVTTGETTPAAGADSNLDIVASGGGGGYVYAFSGGASSEPRTLTTRVDFTYKAGGFFATDIDLRTTVSIAITVAAGETNVTVNRAIGAELQAAQGNRFAEIIATRTPSQPVGSNFQIPLNALNLTLTPYPAIPGGGGGPLQKADGNNNARLNWTGGKLRDEPGADTSGVMMVTDSSTPPRTAGETLTVIYVLPPSVAVTPTGLAGRNATGETITVASLAYSGGATGGALTASLASSDGNVELINNEVVVSVTTFARDLEVTVFAYQSDNDTAPNATVTLDVNLYDPFRANPRAAETTITAGHRQPAGDGLHNLLTLSVQGFARESGNNAPNIGMRILRGSDNAGVNAPDDLINVFAIRYDNAGGGINSGLQASVHYFGLEEQRRVPAITGAHTLLLRATDFATQPHTNTTNTIIVNIERGALFAVRDPQTLTIAAGTGARRTLGAVNALNLTYPPADATVSVSLFAVAGALAGKVSLQVAAPPNHATIIGLPVAAEEAPALLQFSLEIADITGDENTPSAKATAAFSVTLLAPVSVGLHGGGKLVQVTTAGDLTIGTITTSGGGGAYKNPVLQNNNRDFALVNNTVLVLQNTENRNESERAATVEVVGDDNIDFTEEAVRRVIVTLVSSVQYEGGEFAVTVGASNFAIITLRAEAGDRPAAGYNFGDPSPGAPFTIEMRDADDARVLKIGETAVAANLNDTSQTITFRVWDGNTPPLSATAEVTVLFINPLGAAAEYKDGGGALTTSIGVTIGEVSGAGGFGGYVYEAIGNDNDFGVKSNGEITAVFNSAATATLQVRVDDMRNNRAVPNTHPFTLSVVVTALHSISAPVFSLTLTTATNPGAIANTPAATLSASGGQPPYTWLREVVPGVFQPNAAGVLGPGVFRFNAHGTLTYNNQAAPSTAGEEAQRTDQLAVEDSSSPPRRFILPAATVYYVLPPAASADVNQLFQRQASGKTITAAALAYSGGSSGGDVTATVLGASGGAAVVVSGGELLMSASASGTVTATINAFDADNDTAQNDSKTITVVFVEPLSLPDLPVLPLTVTTRDANPQNAQAGVALPVLLTASGGNGTYTYKTSPAVTHNGGEGVNAVFNHNANGLLQLVGSTFPNDPLTATVEVVVTDNEEDGFRQTLTADVLVAFVHPPALAIAFGGAFNNTPQTVAAGTDIIIGTVVMTGGAGALNMNLASGADDGFALNAIAGEAGETNISAQLLLGGDNTSRRIVTAKITGDDDNHPGTEPATLDAVVEVSDALRVEDVVVTFTIGAALPADNTPALTVKVNGGVKPYAHFHNTPASGLNPHQRIRGDALLGPDNVLRWNSVGVISYGPGPMRRAPAASVVQMSVSSLNQQGATFGVNDAVGAARPYIIYAHFVALTAQVSATRIIPLSQFNIPGTSATVANLTFGGGAHGGATARAPGAANGAASVVGSQLVMSTPDSPVSVEVVATVVGYDSDTAGVPESTIFVTAHFNHPLRAIAPRLTLTTGSRYGTGPAITVSAYGGTPPYTYWHKSLSGEPSQTPAIIDGDNVLRYNGGNVINFVDNPTPNFPRVSRQSDAIVIRDSSEPQQEFTARFDIQYLPKPLEVDYQQVLDNVVANDQFAVVANITDIPFVANEQYTVIGVDGIVIGTNDPRTVTTRVEFTLRIPPIPIANRPEFIGRVRSYTRLVFTVVPGQPAIVANRNIGSELQAGGDRRALRLESNEPAVLPVGANEQVPNAPGTYTLFPYPPIIASQGGARIANGDLQMRSRVLAQDVVATIAVIDPDDVFPGGTAQVTVDFVPPPVVISESGIDDRIVNTGEYTVGVFAISGGEGALSFTHNAGGNVGAYNFGLALNAAGDIATATLSAPRNGKITITVTGNDSHPFTPAASFVWTVTVTHAPITIGAPSFNGIAQRAGGGGAGAMFTVAGGLLTGEHYTFNLLGNPANVSALDDELRISVSNFAAPATLTLTFSIDDDDDTAPAATGSLTVTIQIQDFIFGDADQSGNLITLTAAARPQVILGSLHSPSGSELGAPFYQYDFGGGTMPAPGFATLFVEDGAAVMSLRASPGNHHLTITADFKVSTPAGDEFFVNYTISIDGPERIMASFTSFIPENRQGTKEESVSDSATLGSIIAISGGELNDGSRYSFRMLPPGQVPALTRANVTPAGLVTSDLLGGGLVTLRAVVDDDGIADPFLLFITARVPLPPPLSFGFTPAIPVAVPGVTTKFTVSISGGKNPFINGFRVGRTGRHHTRVTFNTPRSGGFDLFSTRIAHTLHFVIPGTYRYDTRIGVEDLPAACDLNTRECPLPSDVWFATVEIANFFDGAYRVITNALTISPGRVNISVMRPVIAQQNNTAPVPAATLLISGGVSPTLGEPYSVWVSPNDNITAFTAPSYTITLTIRVNTMNQEQELKIPRIIDGAQILAFKDTRTVQAVTLTVAADDGEDLTPNGHATIELTVAPPVQTGRDIVTVTLPPNLPRATAAAFAATLATLTSETNVAFDADDNGSPSDNLRFLTFKPDTENEGGTVGYFVHIPSEGSQPNLIFNTITLRSQAGLVFPQPVFIENGSPAEQFSVTIVQPLVGAYFYGRRPHTVTLGQLTASGGYLVGYNAGAFYNYAINDPALRAPQNVSPLTAGNNIVGILTLSLHADIVTAIVTNTMSRELPGGGEVVTRTTATTRISSEVRKLNQPVTVRAFDDLRNTLARIYTVSYFLRSDTRLHAAAALGDIPALNAALAVSGVDKNAHAADGMTPLDLARIYNQSAAETALQNASAGCGRTCPITAFNENPNPHLGGSVYLIGGGEGGFRTANSIIYVASDINPAAGFSPFATITANAELQRHGHRVIFANGTVVVAGGFNSNNGDVGPKQIMYSTDMTIWFTSRAFPGQGLGRGQLYKLPINNGDGVRIFYSGGYTGAANSASRHIYYSDNGGHTWQTRNNGLPAASYNHAVAELNGTLYMMGVQGAGNGARFYRSTDGLTWTNVPMRQNDLDFENYPGRPNERRAGMLMLAHEALSVNIGGVTAGKTPQFFFVGGDGAFQRNQAAGRSNMAVSWEWNNNRPENFNEPGQFVPYDFTDASGWCVPARINANPYASQEPKCYSTHGTNQLRRLREMIFPIAGNYCVREGLNTCPRSTTPAFGELRDNNGFNLQVLPEKAKLAPQIVHIPRGVRARQGHNSKLHEAAKAGDTVAIQTALDAGRPVNIVGADGNTPLHFAAQVTGENADAKAAAAVELLLSNGATMFVNAINNFNQTPRDLALNTGNTTAAEKIKEAGGTCSSRTGTGCQ